MPRAAHLHLASLALALAAAACGNTAGSDAGTPSSSSCPGTLPACPAPAPTYAAAASVIASRCMPCHQAGGIADAKHDLTTYESVYAQRAAVLSQVHACLMPPGNATPLTDAEYTTLVSWLTCDAPQ